MTNEDIEELNYQVNILLEGALYFAGVKKNKLEKAVEIYIDSVDEILDKNQSIDGVDEVILTINSMKISHKELFE